MIRDFRPQAGWAVRTVLGATFDLRQLAGTGIAMPGLVLSQRLGGVTEVVARVAEGVYQALPPARHPSSLQVVEALQRAVMTSGVILSQGVFSPEKLVAPALVNFDAAIAHFGGDFEALETAKKCRTAFYNAGVFAKCLPVAPPADTLTWLRDVFGVPVGR